VTGVACRPRSNRSNNSAGWGNTLVTICTLTLFERYRPRLRGPNSVVNVPNDQGRVAHAAGRWLDARRDFGCRAGGTTVEEVRMELSLSTRTVDDHTVLEVGGEVDVYTAPRLRERLVELVEAGARSVIVDLSRVEFLDSTGLGVLVGALKRLRAAGGTLALVCGHERLLKIFRITALDRVFALYDSVEAATAATGADAGQSA
jgi:anti-sigma B factor antagonist